jgi:hypothetical protein
VYGVAAGCLGGNPILAYEYIRDRGLTSALSYPYSGEQGECRASTVSVSCE